MPLMDLAVRTRYPKDGDVTKGPIKLASIDPDAAGETRSSNPVMVVVRRLPTEVSALQQ
jgi:hypothetical protein